MMYTNQNLNNLKQDVINAVGDDYSLLGDMIYEADKHNYKEKPVSIRQFYTDPYYLGATFNNVYQYWKDVLDDIYPNPFYSPYYEIILSAGTGCGKTTLSTIGMLYDIYKLGCLVNPRDYYGLDESTDIVFGLFSANLQLAGDVNWGKIVEGLLNSPWFSERLVDERGLKKKAGSLNLVQLFNKIGIQMGSRFQHTMGKAIFGALLDEAAFQQEKSQQAQKTYSELSIRMASRLTELTNMPGHLWLASSPKDASDFLQERITKSKGIKGILIKDNIAQWHVKPNMLKQGTFKVFVGSENKDPFIVENEKDLKDEDLRYVIDVPNQYKDKFKLDIVIAIMNLAGIRSISDMAFIKSVSVINESMTLDNPFTKNVFTLPFGDGEGEIMDFMNLSYFKDIRYPEYKRFIHLDYAYSSKTLDRLGIAAVYSKIDDVNIYKYISDDHIINLDDTDKTFIVDFAIGIEPVKGEEISLKKVERFIKYLKSIDYPIGMISADTFQSKRSLQEFELCGFNTQNISVDRSRDPYIFYRQLLNRRKIIQVRHDLLKKELLGLRDDGTKIDHESTGSKDVADAVCGAITSCSMSKNFVNMLRLFTKLKEPDNLGPSEQLDDLNNLNSDELEVYNQYMRGNLNLNNKRMWSKWL